jgi:hypothetical protein
VPYYSADVLVNQRELAVFTERLTLYPGMLVEVMIDTGRRTLLDTFRLLPAKNKGATAGHLNQQPSRFRHTRPNANRGQTAIFQFCEPVCALCHGEWKIPHL